MKPLLVFVALVALVVPNAPLAAHQPALDGYWWEKLDASFKLGWVSGYAKAMDLAGTIQMSTCASNMPLYVKEFPSTDPKVILQKMCLSDNQFDYDGVSMGQFVDGMNAFYKDYRNKQLEVGWAIQYARDAIKGKPTQELDAEVALWRRCSAADKSHPMPRSSEDAAQISKACTPDPTRQLATARPPPSHLPRFRQRGPANSRYSYGSISINIDLPFEFPLLSTIYSNNAII